MIDSHRNLIRELRELKEKLACEGWDRLRGVRLTHASIQVLEACKRLDWLEAIGRAGTLAEVLGGFVHEAPQGEQLAQALRLTTGLADLLEAGRPGVLIDHDNLPAHPEEWLFLLMGELRERVLAAALQSLGFSVASAETVEDAVGFCRPGRTILIAHTSWLTVHAERIAALLGKGGTAPLLVAVSDSEAFLVQIKARQVGAQMLLDAPLDIPRMISGLAGLAWAPRVPYRILLIDDDTAVLAIHADILREAGFEVLASDDPVAMRDFLDQFAPEVCVLDVEMPACRGTDLAALLRQSKRFAHLPVIYLSAYADIEHQLEARQAGGGEYLTKPVEARLLVATVLARVRQFRRAETIYRLRRQDRRQLDSLRSSLDAHALISVSAPDGTIIDTNAKFCAVSGYRREELIGRNHRIIKSGHHTTAFFEEMWGTVAAGKIWQGEIKNRRKDGSHYWVQSTIAPILDEHGLPERYIAIRTDITEQKRVLAGQGRRSRLFDLLRQVMQEFLVHQDIEASSGLLLDGILLLTDSASGLIGEVLHDPEGAPYFKAHAISGASREDANPHEPAKTTVEMECRHLDALIGEVLRTGEAVVANAHDPGRTQDGLSPPHDCLVIPIHLENALVGLLGMDHRPGGYDDATVDFLQTCTATYAALIDAARTRHYQQQAVIALQQSLGEVERNNLATVESLSRWSQESRTHLNNVVGHAQIMLMQEGLDAQAREGARTIIQSGQQCARLIAELVSLPDRKVSPPAQPRPGTAVLVQPQAEGTRQRILVAEDNQANQAVLRMQLDVLGYAPDIAGDGVAAMARWQQGGHALILADLNMPGMDGLELARAIRASERNSGAHVPIIAITAVRNPEDMALCRQAGMDDALPKPIELDDLRHMLERWLPLAAPAPASLHGSTKYGQSRVTGATLDVDHLARVVGNVDAKQIRELLDLFTATVRGDLPACQRALVERNGRALALNMHKLKSSSRMVGALRFASLVEAIEDASKLELLDTAASLFVELVHALDDVEVAAGRLVLGSVMTEVFTPRYGPLPRHILVVDDDPVARRQLSMLLGGFGVGTLLTVDDAGAALMELLREDAIDLLISDLNMPGMDGIEFLRRVAESDYRGDLILSSGVEERLLQTAAEFARAKGLNLRGTLKKPVTRDALLQLLTSPCVQATTASGLCSLVSPGDILEGIHGDEFEVHFQPKVDAASLSAVGVEALARWQRAGKAVPPDLFIAVAEQHGLIGQLSEVLITKALIGGARLEEAGFPLSVSVNVSANWLSDVRLPEFILASIQAAGFKAEHLILEITETGLMADMATALDVMSRLRLKGFKLSIDDFGMGYSSLDQLQRFPFSELKLDRSFVQGAAEKPAARAILASTLEMASKLKLTTVAEGVETQSDLDLVRGLGCDLVQGWFVARAMPLDQLIEWLRARKI